MKPLPRSIPLLMSKQVHPQPKDSIQIRFERFHTQNPGVYTKLVGMARDVKQNGHKEYGIESLFAVLRWHHDMETKGEIFKLNNNFTSRYARLIMENEPDLKGFFRTRPICKG